ncbi:4'-phosphopantetheinyl transferase superfamily protein [Actinocrinis puniceicyclus]|uniref:4'-phosphopantetheinyl transferase superfamily protein n=1 Tax=Actinocrinis puniceicyclus TaxID=977794 RepID=A0A8J7WPK6_9ACTN|nr:4'-phosphopantetheinyl transferase superfamily protein [Actinocrinis puniceicyclus]
MIEQLLPPKAVAVEALEDPPQATLFPQERALLAKAVEKRRLEFTTVRHCARQALARLGVAAVPILPGERGAPRWPDGIVGSMTHCVGYRAAVVARAADLTAVGVDAEPHEPLPPEVLGAITVPQERPRLSRLVATRPGVHWDRLLFSAKESVYKAWFPLTGRWLGFEDASVEFAEPADGEPDGTGAFHARLLVPGPVVAGVARTGFAGRWLVRDGLLLTAVTVTPDGHGATEERTIVL